MTRPGPALALAALAALFAADASSREAADPRPAESAGGKRSGEVVASVVRSHSAEVRACYDEQRLVDPELAGTVVVGWQIDEDGRVHHPAVDRRASTTHPLLEKVGSCMVERIARWTFPRAHGMTTVTYPWVLRARR